MVCDLTTYQQLAQLLAERAETLKRIKALEARLALLENKPL